MCLPLLAIKEEDPQFDRDTSLGQTSVQHLLPECAQHSTSPCLFLSIHSQAEGDVLPL